MDLESADLYQADEAVDVVHDHVVLLPLLLGDWKRTDRVRHALRRMLLEEARLSDAFRAAHERQRSLCDVRQHPRRDPRIVVSEVTLRYSRLGVEHALGVREFDAGKELLGLRASARFLRRGGPLVVNVEGRLVIAQAEKGSVSQDAVLGSLSELHLRDKLRRNEVHAACIGSPELLDERRLPSFEGPETPRELCEGSRREAGADLADVAHAVLLANAEQESAEVTS